MINIEICKVRFILNWGQNSTQIVSSDRHCQSEITDRIMTVMLKATLVLTSQFGSMKNAHSKSDISWSLIDSIPKIAFKLNNSLTESNFQAVTSACLVCQKMTTLHQLQTIPHRTGFLMECWTDLILIRNLKKTLEMFTFSQNGWLGTS